MSYRIALVFYMKEMDLWEFGGQDSDVFNNITKSCVAVIFDVESLGNGARVTLEFAFRNSYLNCKTNCTFACQSFNRLYGEGVFDALS